MLCIFFKKICGNYVDFYFLYFYYCSIQKINLYNIFFNVDFLSTVYSVFSDVNNSIKILLFYKYKTNIFQTGN